MQFVDQKVTKKLSPKPCSDPMKDSEIELQADAIVQRENTLKQRELRFSETLARVLALTQLINKCQVRIDHLNKLITAEGGMTDG